MSAETKLLACPECDWLDGEHAPYCPRVPAPTREHTSDAERLLGKLDVVAAYADAAYIASIHAHHALWSGLLDYGWDEKTERFGMALADRISREIAAKARKLPQSTARTDEPVTANYGRQHISGPAVEAIENGQDTEELAAPPSPDTVREALELAEDVLSRAPFSNAIWPNGVHPQTGITKIRDAIAALSNAPVAMNGPVAGAQKTHHIKGPFASPIKAGERDLGVCLDCGVNDGHDHMPGCSALANSRNELRGSQL